MPVLHLRSTIKFGLFELDTEARELYRNGIRIKVAPQPLDLLTALIEHPGTVISRDVLRQRLWPPNTYVDYEQGLNKAVRKLREALDDSAESPRYIETVQRIGYRFIAPIQLAADLPVTAPPIEEIAQLPPDTPSQNIARQRLIQLLVASLIVVAGVAAAWMWTQRTMRVSQAPSAKIVNPKAQEAYLHGRYLWFGEQALASYDYFKRATELQPDYSPAWAGISLYYGAAMIRGHLDPAEGIELQEEAAVKSVRFDPALSEAHLAMCGTRFMKTWQYQAANAECDRALQLDPKNAEVYHFQSKMLAAIDRPQTALET